MSISIEIRRRIIKMKKHGIICMFILMIIVSMITGCGSNSEPVA